MFITWLIVLFQTDYYCEVLCVVHDCTLMGKFICRKWEVREEIIK